MYGIAFFLSRLALVVCLVSTAFICATALCNWGGISNSKLDGNWGILCAVSFIASLGLFSIVHKRDAREAAEAN